MTLADSAPTLADPTDRPADDAAIRAVIADVEAGLNGNDPDLMTRHFAADAVGVGVNGRSNAGRETIYAAHVKAVAPGGFLRDSHARYEVAEVTFVGPDTAVVHKLARAATADGELVDHDPSMSALYVFVRRDGRWWIAARQNTLISS